MHMSAANVLTKLFSIFCLNSDTAVLIVDVNDNGTVG